MADYSQLVDDVKKCYDVRVRKWRRSMSGCAWRVYYHDGRVINWIEAPIPRTPISLAIFLHEVGHHVIGFYRYRRRCEEEYHVWLWALRQIGKRNLALRDAAIAEAERLRLVFVETPACSWADFSTRSMRPRFTSSRSGAASGCSTPTSIRCRPSRTGGTRCCGAGSCGRGRSSPRRR